MGMQLVRGEMMDYQLMNTTHVSAVAELEKLCFSDPWSVNAISSELSNPLSLWVVAIDGDRLVGYVGSQSVMGWADMMNLAVDPAYRRMGVGRKLVNELIAKLQENDVTCLTLEVRASNAGAIALYVQLGFIPVGRRPNYYRNPKEDALILRKEWQL